MMKHYLTLALCIIAALVGYFGWNGETSALLLLPLVIWIWRTSTSRITVFCALFAYYSAASRGLLVGASIFFSDPGQAPSWWIGVVIWLFPSALLALTWMIGWGTKFKGLRIILIIVALSVPPIGIVGWANPLTSAGVLFPGLGWFGLAAALVLFVLIAEAPRPAFLAPLVLIAGYAYAVNNSAAHLPSWVSIDTELGGAQDVSSEFHRMQKLQSIVRKEIREAGPGAVILLPELVGGDWSVNALWWEPIDKELRDKNQSLLIGVHRPVAGKGYVNSLVGIGSASGVELIDRVPVPIAMWKPWTEGGALSAWWGSGSAVVNDRRIGHLICYEQLLMWPMLISAANSPEAILAVSNVWWAKETSIPAIQKQVVKAWAMLFDLPVLIASNS